MKQFANEVQTFLKEDYRTVKVEKNGKVSVVVYAGFRHAFPDQSW